MRTFLHDAIDFCSMAVHKLEADDFTQCFTPVNQKELHHSGILYVFSILIRYFILFPFRVAVLTVCLLVFLMWLALCVIFHLSLEKPFKFCIHACLWSFGARIHNYGNKQRIDEPHFYVSNHTSFVDYLVLSSYKFVHATISESHGGLFGLIFNSLLTRIGCLCFKRSNKKERLDIKQALLKKQTAYPFLIFPEGTCVNNKYTVLFQKGAFDMDCLIVPVAIKYKKTNMDPYWNRKKHNFTMHMLYLMTRWSLEADVVWMDPTRKYENETSTQFAMRVKLQISNKASLKCSLWNGYFKSSPMLRDGEILRHAYVRTYLNLKKEKEAELRMERSKIGPRSAELAEDGAKSPTPIGSKLLSNDENSITRSVGGEKDEIGVQPRNVGRKLPSRRHRFGELKPDHSKALFGLVTYEHYLDNLLKEYLVLKLNSGKINIKDEWLYSSKRLYNTCSCKMKGPHAHNTSCKSEMYAAE